jgi:MerR family mercuric resistance operon transcriptional regulator
MSGSSNSPESSRSRSELRIALDSLRFLGRAGLLPNASPDADATPEYRERLRFIERARALGFDLHEIRELLSVSDGVLREMTPLRASIERQVENIELRIVALMRVRQALLQTQERLDRHSPYSHCPVVAALQDESGD